MRIKKKLRFKTLPGDMNERKKRRKKERDSQRAHLFMHVYTRSSVALRKQKKVSRGYNTQKECVLRVDYGVFEKTKIEAFF